MHNRGGGAWVEVQLGCQEVAAATGDHNRHDCMIGVVVRAQHMLVHYWHYPVCLVLPSSNWLA